jgi:hypothetical protein
MNKDASRKKDFDERIDVIPVSDPNATTMAQRIMQYQAALQLAQQAPQMYDLPQLHKQMLETLAYKMWIRLFLWVLRSCQKTPSVKT